MDKETLIVKGRDIFGDKYDYSLVPDYFSVDTKIKIICPIHGEFLKTPYKHINGRQGCPSCSGKKRYTNEEFIAKARELPNSDGISFEKCQYKRNKDNVTLTCHKKDKHGNEHGDFTVTPGHFLSGEGCPKCRYDKSSEKKRRNLGQLIECIKKVHGDKYDYSKMEYTNDSSKVCIICPKHGEFYQTINNHLRGEGCPMCGKENSSKNRTMSFEEFEERSKKVHEGQYEYHREGYDNTDSIIRITCPKHGDFYQKAGNHLYLGYCCPKCSACGSKGEKELYEFIVGISNSEVVQNDRETLCGNHELDVYVPEKKFAVEYDGLRWHSELSKPNDYHLFKTNLCSDSGIRLFHVFEDEWAEKKDIVKSMIRNILGVTENKVYARKCKIMEVPSDAARKFLDENHLQGYCQSTIRLGLYHDGELVSLMTFGKSRHFVGNGKHEWELLRFVNKMDTVVIGGASKLFSHFVKEHAPNNIVSYADKRWSIGNLYERLGFKKYNDSKPNYFYIVGGKRVYRFNLRKSVLVEKFGCPKEMTEREFCYRNGWYRIYDCGCLCYEWKKEKGGQ